MKRVVVPVLLCLLLLTAPSLAQSDNVTRTNTGYIPSLGELYYTYGGAGARGFAMGGAMAGLANDVTAGTWNPAGLWVIEGPIVSASYVSFIPSGESNYNLTPKPIEIGLQSNAFGHFSFATPMRIKGHPFVFAFDYVRNNNYADEFTEKINPQTELNPDLFFEDQAHLKTYNFGLSTRLYKQFSIGFMTNIYDGRRVSQQVTQFVKDSTVIEGPPPQTVTKFKEVVETDSVISTGVNFTIGAMYKLDKLSLGLTVFTPFQMSNETDYTKDSSVTAAGLFLPEESGIRYIDNLKTKQDIPLSGIFGIGFQASDNLNLTLDFNYQNYGSVDYYQLDSSFFEANGDRIDFFSSVPINWNNTMGIGTGAEYLLNTGIGRIPLRAGVRFDQLPRPQNYNFRSVQQLEETETENVYELTSDYTRTLTASERQNTYSFSIGTGLHWSLLEFDFAYRFTTGKELNITETITRYQDSNNDNIADLDEDDNPIPVTSEFNLNKDQTTHEFRFTLVGYFQ